MKHVRERLSMFGGVATTQEVMNLCAKADIRTEIDVRRLERKAHRGGLKRKDVALAIAREYRERVHEDGCLSLLTLSAHLVLPAQG